MQSVHEMLNRPLVGGRYPMAIFLNVCGTALGPVNPPAHAEASPCAASTFQLHAVFLITAGYMGSQRHSNLRPA